MIHFVFKLNLTPDPDEAARVKQLLGAIDGTMVHDVNPVSGEVILDYDGAMVLSRIIAGLNDAGYRLDIVKKHFDGVKGMTCTSCVSNVGQISQRVPGMISAEASIPSNTLDVVFVETGEQEKKLRALLNAAGYHIPEDHNDASSSSEPHHLARNRLLLALFLGIPVIALNFTTGISSEVSALVQGIFMLVMTVFPARQFYTRAIRQLRFHLVGMDALISLSTGIALAFSYYAIWNNFFSISSGNVLPTHFHSAAMILVFVHLGKWIEEQVRQKAVASMTRLLSIRPNEVTREMNGRTERVDPMMIRKGDRVIAATGERIGVDGAIASGEAMVDESLLTGEAIPVEKTTSDKVLSGTLIVSGNLTIEAAGSGEDGFLEQVIQRVRQAQAGKVHMQTLADKAAGFFVPLVLVLSVVTFCLWCLVDGSHWYEGMVHALTVLVVACPCALGLATPVAIAVATGTASSQGIILKNANSLEKLEKITHIVFDKTGTLTTGKLRVMEIVWSGEPDSKLRAVWHAMEEKSIHPMALALTRSLCSDLNVAPAALQAIEEVPGKGMQCVFKGEAYKAGSPSWFGEFETPESIAGRMPDNANRTAVFFGKSNRLLAAAWLEDEMRDEAPELLRSLRAESYTVYLATGDRESAARMLAESAGIPAAQVRYGMSPEDKINFVAHLKENGNSVLMTGDGVNDAPALAEADVSVAMQAGAGIAQEQADITLGHDNLLQLEKAMRLSKKTMAVIRQNLFWAFGYNVLALPLASGLIPHVYLPNPGLAALAMSMSSVIVTVNSLRISRSKDRK